MLHSLSLQWDYLPEREHCLFLFFFFFCSSGLNVHYLNTCRVVDNIGMFLLFLSCVFVKASLFLGQFLCLGGGGSIMSRLRCLKVLPYRCVKKKKKILNKLFAFMQVFYQFIGALVEYCLLWLLQVTTWRLYRFHQCVPLFVWLRPLNPAVLQRSNKFELKKGSFNCSAIVTKCPNSQLRSPLRTHWQHALPFSDKWLKRTISPFPPRKSLFNFYICMKYTLCVPHLYVKR